MSTDGYNFITTINVPSLDGNRFGEKGRGDAVDRPKEKQQVMIIIDEGNNWDDNATNVTEQRGDGGKDESGNNTTDLTSDHAKDSGEEKMNHLHQHDSTEDDHSTHSSHEDIRADTTRTTAPPSPLAILHIGPHKTGSTTIQSLMKRFVKELAMDRYEMPWVAIGGWESQVHLATCFLNKAVVNHPCDQRLIESAKSISKRNSNILISSEEFDREYVNMTSLNDFLTPWNVTVVYVYRRFYSWLQSYHFELSKKVSKKVERFLANSTDYLRTNITEFIYPDLTHINLRWMERYRAAQRYKQESYYHVVILNMHNEDMDILY